MLSCPPGLDESTERGRGFVTNQHAAIPLAKDGDDKETCKGVFSSSRPRSSSVSSSPVSSLSPPSPPPHSSSSSSPPSSLAPCPHVSSPSLTPLAATLSPPLALFPSLCPPFPTPPFVPSPAPPVSLPSISWLAASICSPPSPVNPPSRSPIQPPLDHSSQPMSPPSSSPVSRLPAARPSPSLPFAPLPPPVLSSPFTLPSTCAAPSTTNAVPDVLPHPPPPLHPSLLPVLPPPAPLSPSSSSSLPAPPPCCPCASLLPRLLASHRAEVRRLLKGALASLGRRLDSLERRSRGRRKRKKKRCDGGGDADSAPSSSSSCPVVFPSSSSNHAPFALVSYSSASSDSEDSAAPSSSLASSHPQHKRRQPPARGEEEDRTGSKRQRKEVLDSGDIKEEEEEEEEEDVGRFVGRMVVSLKGRGAEEEEAPLTLQNYSTRGRSAEREDKTLTFIMARTNGFPQGETKVQVDRLSSRTSSSSQHALDFVRSSVTRWRNGEPDPVADRWSFSDSAPFVPPLPNHRAFRLHLRASSASAGAAPLLRLSALAVDTFGKGGACVSPTRPLKDWTPPPSLGVDHCYMRIFHSASSARRQRKQRANHSLRSIHPSHRRPLPSPPSSTNGVPLTLHDNTPEVCSDYSRSKEKEKRVSQIRIRRATPRETPLTPMGLPKVKRLKKKEFSLEEIYTNKNYKSPTANRSLETIFEEPREKDGALLLIGQQRRRRLLLFPDFTQPRKRKKPQGAGLPVVTAPRKRLAARRHCHGSRGGDDETDLDVMLVERLSALEDFLLRQGLEV